jgi:hypothetical protein
MQMTQLICDQCGKSFERRTAEVNQARQRGNSAYYCSRTCVGTAKQRWGVVRAACRQCGGSFSRRSHGRKERGLFCSRRCAAQYKSAQRATGGPICATCGGPKSYTGDICHIRDVASFPDSATVGEVNNPANLIALDKRCHWEFDHGYLTYVDGRIVAGAGLEPAASWL